MRIADSIEQMLSDETPDELFQTYLRALADFGVDQVMYSPLRNTAEQETKIPGISYNYPGDWVSYYMENDFIHVDPVRRHCMESRKGFLWKDMIALRELSAPQAQVMDQGEEAGLNDGVAVPFHGPFGELYGVGMACSLKNPDVAHGLDKIEALSVHFHTRFSNIYDHTRNRGGTPLTPRELEVLKWCARGKSNWAIGEILSISEHGVDFHVRNILKKLDSDSRLTAVVKAMHSGILHL